jgi:hypothetical protein
VDEADVRELEYAGRPLRVRGGAEPLRPWRGFFSGDAYEAHGEHVEGPGAPGAHQPDVTIEFDGQVFGLHRTTSGKLHSHMLPFVAFSSVDEAAYRMAELVDTGVLSGPAEEPQEP